MELQHVNNILILESKKAFFFASGLLLIRSHSGVQEATYL